MVCACLLELQEAKNADEALRLYAEKRTRNGQGVTIPSQRRYVQYYSRLLSSSPRLNYEPTPLRLTSVRIEGLPHQLHGIQSKLRPFGFLQSWKKNVSEALYFPFF